MRPSSAAMARAGLVMVLVFGTFSTAGAENRRIFSYDPADGPTRAAAGGLTFEFDQHLTSTRLLRVRATEGPATAELKRVGEGRLGPGGLNAAVGGKAAERDLYEIQPKEEGGAMIQALCPGAARAWLAADRLHANRDLTVLVVGAASGGPARLCRTLHFSFHGEWRLPPGPGVDPRTVRQPHFPY
ncbi:MAG: hypothetical protein ACYC8V_14130 [Caulobacteraceae bacterium]